MTAESLITCDPKILNGTPVFKGTRVPVRTLFDYLSDGLSLEYFLESFPSVSRELATDVLRLGQERIGMKSSREDSPRRICSRSGS
jgi:uncharacterized protein (DUF433 family)